MKFVIFSPLAKTSAIGRVTALIVGAMVQLGHTAVVVRTERGTLLDTVAHACEARILSWMDAPAIESVAEEADALVYQIGNNYDYHFGGLHWLAKHPGIVCLHDFLVSHLFAEWAQDRRVEADHVLSQWYGDEAARNFFSTENECAFIEMASRSCPMTEWICSQALCVVAHSHWGMPRVAQSCPGPVRVLPLPYDAPSVTPASDRTPSPDGRVNMLTVGHVNPNKRIESVIRAIGTSHGLREQVRYRLCGLIQRRVAQELSELASTLGVELVISGEMDDLALRQAMNEADIVCCLRWPSLESASATTIEGLLYGKAVVVTNAAFYSELPDDCVRKISPGNEINELRTALENLCGDAEARQRLSVRGQQWATETFSARNYVGHLEVLAQLTATSRPAIAMVGLLSDILGSWHASPALIASNDIAQPLELFQATAAKADHSGSACRSPSEWPGRRLST